MSNCLAKEGNARATLDILNNDGYHIVKEVINYDGCNSIDCDTCNFIHESFLDDAYIEGAAEGVNTYKVGFIGKDCGKGVQVFLELEE